MTSTSGVTLMLAISSESSDEGRAAMSPAPAGGAADGVEMGEHLSAERVGAGQANAARPLKQIEKCDRGERHQEPNGGRDEGWPDVDQEPRRNLRPAAPERVERAHDADYSAEEAHKRRVA